MKGTTEGLVLRRFDFGDTSQIGHFLCPDMGRISLLAKGAKKPNPSIKGPIDLFQHARIGYRLGPGSDLGLLTRYEPVRDFHGLRSRLDRLLAGFYVIEILRELSREGASDRDTFHSGLSTLETLATAAESALPAVLAAREFELLRLAGFAPALERCARCGRRPAVGTIEFHFEAGGVFCEVCPRTAGPTFTLTADLRALLKGLADDGAAAARIRIAPVQRRQLRGLLRGIWRSVLERALLSEPFVSDPAHGSVARAAGTPRRGSVDGVAPAT